MADELNFDTEPEIAVTVTIRSKTYTLKEPSGGGYARFSDAQLKAAQPGPDGKLIVREGLADTELILVQECLWDGDKRVTSEFVGSLPHRITSKLYDTIRSWEKKDPKASSTGTKDGSGSQTASE